MTVQISIRDVPESVRNELAARAARRGQSMQEFLHGELVRMASRPPVEEWLERVRERKGVAQRRVSASAILQARDAERR